MFVLQEIHPNVKNMKDLVFYVISKRANQISEELRQVMTYLENSDYRFHFYGNFKIPFKYFLVPGSKKAVQTSDKCSQWWPTCDRVETSDICPTGNLEMWILILQCVSFWWTCRLMSLGLLQVLAACLYPELVNSPSLPADARLRAQRILGECAGGSVGSYDPVVWYSTVILISFRFAATCTCSIAKVKNHEHENV